MIEQSWQLMGQGVRERDKEECRTDSTARIAFQQMQNNRSKCLKTTSFPRVMPFFLFYPFT